MGVIVDLAKVIEALENPEEWECFLDRNTGDVIAITEDDAPYIEGFGDSEADEEDFANLPQWQRDSILSVRRALESADLIPLPDKFDFHEWDVMRRFAISQPEPARGDLLDAIQGRGSFRLFRRTLEILDLRDQWFQFRNDALRRFALDWLNENGLACSG
jgi:hypothetical protein